MTRVGVSVKEFFDCIDAQLWIFVCVETVDINCEKKGMVHESFRFYLIDEIVGFFQVACV